MAPKPLAELVDPGWAAALGPVESQIAAMGEFLRAETAAGRRYLPAGDRVLRAFTYPLADVRVLIVGQDPYPTPGHPIGLSFAVERDVRPVPRSLANIFTEYTADLGYPKPSNGDLSGWAQRGHGFWCGWLSRQTTGKPAAVLRRDPVTSAQQRPPATAQQRPHHPRPAGITG